MATHKTPPDAAFDESALADTQMRDERFRRAVPDMLFTAKPEKRRGNRELAYWTMLAAVALLALGWWLA